MVEIHRSALLQRPVEFMFELINDVEAYPQYMSGCEKVEVLERSETIMVATLHVRKAGLKQQFTTRNKLSRPEKVQLELVDGPFAEFFGQWLLQPLAADACKVNLQLNFTVQSRLASKALEALFRSVGDELVEAVCKRAAET